MKKRKPNVADLETIFLGDCVVSVYLDGFTDSPPVPVGDRSYEFGAAPVDRMISFNRVLDDGRLVVVP